MILLSHPYGRLANQLFLFGHLIAFAHEHGHRVAFPAFSRYADAFPAFAGDPLCRYPRRTARHLPGGGAAAALARGLRTLAVRAPGRAISAVVLPDGQTQHLADPEFVALADRAKLLVVSGFAFRDEPAFARCAGMLREVFRPTSAIAARAAAAVAHARSGGRPLVGVHRRRGDYAVWMGGRHLLSDAALVRAMAALREDLGDATFLICSDEPWDPRHFAGMHVAGGAGDPLADLHALAGCDYIIGPPSTYSMWASFYGAVPRAQLESAEARPSLAAMSVVSG